MTGKAPDSEAYSPIYVRHLLPLFGFLDPPRHPWWWPKNGGKTLEDWGLTAEAVLATDCLPDSVLMSLRRGPSLKNPPPQAYQDFPGGVVLRSPEKLVWVLSSRPSGDSFPNSGPTTTKLYRVLQSAGLLECVHVTDFVKFRGPGPDASADEDLDGRATIEGLSRTLRDVSLECLEAEWKVAAPKAVLVAGDKTQRWVAEQVARSSFSAQSKFAESLAAAMIPVTSWMATKKGVQVEDIADEWARAARGY